MSEYGTEETGFSDEPEPVRPARPRNRKHRVRLATDVHSQGSHDGLGKTVLETEDEAEARRYIEQHHPRGSEAVLQLSDGSVQHYSADHAAQFGNGWSDFGSEDDE